MDKREKAIEIVGQIGFSAFGFVDMTTLKYYDEVRKICEGNACQKYGTTWACPPAIGTIEECKNRIANYQNMLLFSKFYQLDDSFDFEGMMNGAKDFKKVVNQLHRAIEKDFSDFFILGNESCDRCEKCTYPDAPCRFPTLLHPSLEGHGFVVSDLAKEANIPYMNGKDTVTYFGAVLFN